MTDPLDREAIAADDELIEQWRDGATPDDWLGERAAAWRDEVQRD